MLMRRVCARERTRAWCVGMCAHACSCDTHAPDILPQYVSLGQPDAHKSPAESMRRDSDHRPGIRRHGALCKTARHPPLPNGGEGVAHIFHGAEAERGCERGHDLDVATGGEEARPKAEGGAVLHALLRPRRYHVGQQRDE